MDVREKISKLLSNPNFLTSFRMAAAPGVVLLLLFPNHFTTMVRLAFQFSLAAISDYLDGFFARKWGLTSNFAR
ncbi:MAG: CDP-alcohol phosphatidyltransferase family protein [Desulfobacterales bacterium]